MSTVRHEEDAFDAADGRRLFERRWLPDGEPRAHVAIVHGYAEHSGRYAHVGEALAQRGYAVHALDLRGHGRSDGDTAIVGSFQEYLVDVRAFLRRVRGRAGGPPFLLGHSMGGTIVTLHVVVDRPQLRGLLLSGAVLPMPGAPQRILSAVVRGVGRMFPRLPLIKLKASDVSRDPDVVQRYEDDPMVYHGRIRAALAAAMQRALARIDRDASSIRLPLLIMHGSADALAPPEGSAELHERVASSDRSLMLYDGLYHEILNEPERDRVIADIVAWLDARTP